jgi:hypothetical protein
MKRDTYFFCANCIDRERRGWWIKNEAPAKCDGKHEKKDGLVVTFPQQPCERQAEWVLVE